MTKGTIAGRGELANGIEKQDDVSRRDLVKKLLGVAAGGVALEALGGCANQIAGSPTEPVGESTEALSGTTNTYAYADSVTALRGAPSAANRLAVLQGSSSAGDGGGGMYYWSGTSALDDGFNIVNATAGTNAAGWRRIAGTEVPTIAKLRTLVAPIAANSSRVVLGFAAPADGAGGLFVWDPTEVGPSPAGDDGGTIIKPTSITYPAAGRWKRLYSGPVNVKWFGARSGSDCTTAIRNAVEALRYSGGAVFFPAGAYLISSRLEFIAANVGEYDNITLCGEGRGSQIKASTAIGVGAQAYGQITFRGKLGQDYSLRGLCLRDLRITGPGETVVSHCLLVHLDETTGARCINVYLDDACREGIHFGDARRNENALLEGCHATRVGGYAAVIGQSTAAYNVNCNNVTMIGNTAYQVGQAVEFSGQGGTFIGNSFDDIGYTNTMSVFVAGVAMNLHSGLIGLTTPGTRTLVQGNRIRRAQAGVMCSTAGECQDISGNQFEQVRDAVIVTVSDNATTTIANNRFFGSYVNTGGSAIYFNQNGYASQSVIEGNTIVAGGTIWAYGIRVGGASTKTVVRHNTFVGDGFTIGVYFVDAANTAAQAVANTFVGVTAGATSRYRWRGVDFTYNGFSGIDNGTVLSTTQPSVVWHSAAPDIGTWSVGDRVVNPTPAAGGWSGWICTTGGTPGIWKGFGAVQA